MVEEDPVARLHKSVRAHLPDEEARGLLTDAGARTAAYILANRIPRVFRLALPLLPTGLSARLLLKAITRHSWTFAGSGHFSGRTGAGLVVRIDDNPLCRGEHSAHPVCHWHAAVFTGLFARLVAPQARCIEFACCATGDEACRFVIDWPRVRIWIQIKARLTRLLPFFSHDQFQPPVPKDQTRAP
jgi:divinyl protochlorophyllide a 8-vinyl-reductase